MPNLIIIFAFAFGIFVGGFISLVVVLFTNVHKLKYKILKEELVYDSIKIKLYRLVTIQCIECGKIKRVKMK
jgi:translation initiation factor 2 beta subunit (eIF-2beta)/eIF-5